MSEITEADLLGMPLHSVMTVNKTYEHPTTVQRVSGGWIYNKTVFVPDDTAKLHVNHLAMLEIQQANRKEKNAIAFPELTEQNNDDDTNQQQSDSADSDNT